LSHHDGVRAAASYAQGALVIAHPGAPSLGIGLGLAGLAENEGLVNNASNPGDDTEVNGELFLVGPEGGFEDAELHEAKLILGLGPMVLRAETAAVALAARLVWFSDLRGSIT
jgi:hypothetical protein